jgi:hypothetical protein
MSAQSNVVERFLFRLGPGGIVVGYVLVLFGVVAGVVAFPNSSILFGLLFVVIGAFFVVAISVNVIVYLFFMVAIYRGLMTIGRRLLFWKNRKYGSQMTSKWSLQQKGLESQGPTFDLWDRWVDGGW